jgi:DNA polymerase I-like protein with 3'-5' exonuclease and polymerase domains
MTLNLKAVKLPKFLEQLNPDIYWSDNYVVLDFETGILDKGSALESRNRLVFASWIQNAERTSKASLQSRKQSTIQSGRLGLGVRFHFGDEYDQAELKRAVESADFIVAHNAKFELQWLKRIGVDISKLLVWDTMLGEYVQAGNRRRNLSLEETAKRRGFGGKVSLVSTLIEGGVCPSEIPEEWLIEYGCEDTRLCHEIFLQQRKELASAGLLPTMFTRCLVTPVLADIELNGVQLDESRVKEKYEEVHTKWTGLRKELDATAGGINWDSPKQIANYLYGVLGFEELRGSNGKPRRTDAGNPLTDADTIDALTGRTDAQISFKRLWAAFRPLDTQLATLEKMLACCKEAGGGLYAIFNQAVTQTHRLSSSGKRFKIQFQNIDRTLKKLFKARKDGWLVGEADGAQLEFRVAAHLGRDSVALADIRNPDFDAHYQTAEQILQKARVEVSKEERSDVKPHTFKPLYGGMSGTEDEKRYYRFFQKKYSGIYKVQDAWTYAVLRDKCLRTETGFILYWPSTKLEVDRRTGRSWITNRTSIFNYPVQSLATAEIIPIALVYFWQYAKALNLKLFLVNTIHDSVIAELPPEEEEIFRELAEYCFTVACFDYLHRVYGVRFTVPLGCETKVGSHWSQGEERKFDLDPDKHFTKAA